MGEEIDVRFIRRVGIAKRRINDAKDVAPEQYHDRLDDLFQQLKELRQELE